MSASGYIGIFGSPWMKSVNDMKTMGGKSATASLSWAWGVRASVGVSLNYHNLTDKSAATIKIF